MAFKEHPIFKTPDPVDSKIWRYTDLSKFLHLIDSESLHFSRIDVLSKGDPLEGLYTKVDSEFKKLKFSDLSNAEKELVGGSESNLKDLQMIKEGLLSHSKYQREITFANCWHINEVESAGMWKIYSFYEQGIAIQSTFSRLKESLASYSEFEIYIGKINYINYENDPIPIENALCPIIYKRKSFEHERELRAIIWTPQNGKNDLTNPDNNKYKDFEGLKVNIDLSKLIENIYISPNCQDWIVKVLKSILSKYEIEINIRRSKINDIKYVK